MPELPEVEVVRRGVERGTAGRRVAHAVVLHPRAVRRHVAGAEDFATHLQGRRLQPARRRGKYLWVPLDDGDRALVGHLGMSGQLLVVPGGTPPQRHLRVRIGFDDGGPDLRFVDQRTFGGLLVDELVDDGGDGRVPASVRHIARDPLDPLFDDDALAPALRRRRTGLKRALLDQTLLSGVGNIYADEALWRAGLHGARPTETVTRPEVARLLAAVREVMTAALQAGGTSFDALYVSAEGVSGLFDRELAVYGREGLPCPRCGTPVRRDVFMNRSSATCPSCQRRPRRARW